MGYQSVEDFYDTNSVMVSADSFFPAGSVNLASIKLFSGTKIDSALLEAASLASHANSILKELLEDIVSEKSQPLSKVENFVYEDSMGLCGWINNRRILLGSRELMQSHNIEGLPTLTKEHEQVETKVKGRTVKALEEENEQALQKTEAQVWTYRNGAAQKLLAMNWVPVSASKYYLYKLSDGSLAEYGTNAGMDACLGFYDEYFELYDLEAE